MNRRNFKLLLLEKRAKLSVVESGSQTVFVCQLGASWVNGPLKVTSQNAIRRVSKTIYIYTKKSGTSKVTCLLFHMHHFWPCVELDNESKNTFE